MGRTRREKPARRGTYTIGELAQLYHIGADTLRYYEEKGLLAPARGANGYRYYSAQSIWRMNVIMNLRRLGFSVERIRRYFHGRTVESTKALIGEELTLIDRQIAQLRSLKRSVQEQRAILEEAGALPLETVRRLEVPPRRAFVIQAPFNEDEEMDLLMRHLLDRIDDVFMIGNNRMASILSEEGEPCQFQGALLFDRRGDLTLPGGTYLSVCYSGSTATRRHAETLRAYARENGLTLSPPFIDLVWVDIHTSDDAGEHLSEVQVRIQSP